MVRYLVFVFGLIGLLVSQAQAEPSAKAAKLMDALSDVFASQIQSGKSSENAKSRSASQAITKRSRHRVVFFTDNKARVTPVLRAVKKLGYGKESFINDEPNDDWNIKWGSASTRKIDEILGVVTSKLGISPSRIERQNKFEADDTDIFVNLRFSKASSTSSASTSSAVSASDLGRHRVVIFTNDKGQVEPLLSAIKRRGFHTESHVNDDPNDDWNIKWGSASGGTIDEVLALVDAEMGIPAERLRRSHEFEANDTDIFINLKF